MTAEPPIHAKAKGQNIHVSWAVLDAGRKEAEELLQSLRTTPEGLTQAEAQERARSTGPNEIAQEQQERWFIRLLKILCNPLVILLGTLSAVSVATGDARAGTVMAAMVVLSVTLRFLQEARADAAAAKLKAMIHVTATVLRDGTAKEMPLRELVPGDIIHLSAGDMIPGDSRVLSSKDLFVSQGSLTGESFPVEKVPRFLINGFTKHDWKSAFFFALAVAVLADPPADAVQLHDPHPSHENMVAAQEMDLNFASPCTQ